MTYEVTLTKGRGVVLFVAVFCMAGLLFVTGVLVGVGLWKPTMDELALAKEYQRRETAPAKQAQVKTLVAAPSAQDAMMPAEQSHPAAVPAVRETATPAEHESATQPVMPLPPAISPAVHEAEAADAAPSSFVLQVGSFRDVKNAQQLQTELNAKGYQATVVNALDSEQRMWHLVRIGHYEDLASAAHDAAKIGGKEQIQALIRRGNGL